MHRAILRFANGDVEWRRLDEPARHNVMLAERDGVEVMLRLRRFTPDGEPVYEEPPSAVVG